jgi:hypothetical protein
MGYTPDEPENKEGVPRGLKYAVIGMGIALVGGMLLLMVLVIGKIASGGEKKARNHCEEAQVSLPEGEILEVREEGPNLIVRLRDGQGQLLLRYHSCSGELLRRVRLSAK